MRLCMRVEGGRGEGRGAPPLAAVSPALVRGAPAGCPPPTARAAVVLLPAGAWDAAQMGPCG